MNHGTDEIARQVAVAVGREPADLVVKNAAVYALDHRGNPAGRYCDRRRPDRRNRQRYSGQVGV